MIVKQSIAGLLVFSLCSRNASLAFSRTIAAGNAANTKVGMPAGTLTPATSLTTLPLNAPALTGGISFAASNLPTLNATDPAALSLPAAGAVAMPSANVPSNAGVVRQHQTTAGSIAPVMPAASVVRRGRTVSAQLSNPAAPKATALGSATELTTAVKKKSRSGFGRAVASLFGRFFDGTGKRSALNAADSVNAKKAAPARRGALGDVVFHALKDGSDIRTNLPRTIVVSDSFIGEAPKATVSRLQTLIDEGVHVVIITDRPDRGEGSIDQILVSKLKPSKSNPIMVASYAGARLSFKEAGSKWSVVNEAGAFEATDLDRFSEVVGRASTRAKLKNTPSYAVSPAK
jgi:hypothetical protein